MRPREHQHNGPFECLSVLAPRPPPMQSVPHVQENQHMGARQKLNAVAVQGCLIVSGIIGMACQSWLIFLITSAVSIGSSLVAGDIRPDRNGPAGPRSTGPHPRSQRNRRRPRPRRR